MRIFIIQFLVSRWRGTTTKASVRHSNDLLAQKMYDEWVTQLNPSNVTILWNDMW